jgi:hypothetical protein
MEAPSRPRLLGKVLFAVPREESLQSRQLSGLVEIDGRKRRPEAAAMERVRDLGAGRQWRLKMPGREELRCLPLGDAPTLELRLQTLALCLQLPERGEQSQK